MPTPRSFIRPLRSFPSSLLLASRLRWICPACERRLQQYRPFAITSQRLNEKAPSKQENVSDIPELAAENSAVDELASDEKAEIPYVEDNYEPATSWKGLERVGGKVWRRKRQVAKPFEGYFSNTTEAYSGDASAAVHRAAVETLLMRGAGSQDLSEFHQLGEESNTAHITLSPDGRTVALSIQQDGNHLSYEAIPIFEIGSSETGELPEIPTTDSGNDSKGAKSWANIPLHDPMLKFTIVKRVMQLTGKRIPDPVIQRSRTAGELSNHLLKKPKPKKLVEALQNNRNLSKLSNVKFHERRVTSIDKETNIGRWKVIEQELLHRDLPVTGQDRQIA